MTKGNWASPANRPKKVTLATKHERQSEDLSLGRGRKFTRSNLDKSEGVFKRLADFEDEYLREQELYEE